MHRYPFIFSPEKKYRLQRHFLFWTSWWAFQSVLYSFSAFAMQVPYLQRLPVSAIEAVLYLVPHTFLAYTLMYWVVPHILLKGKYVKSALVVMGLFLATAAIASFIGMFVIPVVRQVLLGEANPKIHINEANFFMGLLAGLRGAITIGGMAAAIKLMKHLYQKEQNNLELQKQHAQAQLQLLKAQVHPHFLFNTMNNIYAHTQATAPEAARMITGLSEMLRYMLYDGAQPLVPLQKELELLRHYILLEEARYDNGIDINLNLPEQTDGLYIAPLLLLPFVENCFKHGTSHMLEQPWITFSITIEEARMSMKLVNGKAADVASNHSAHGIGIANVRKRLQLLYPQKHQLKITAAEDLFIVDLKLKLHKRDEGVATPATTQKIYA